MMYNKYWYNPYYCHDDGQYRVQSHRHRTPRYLPSETGVGKTAILNKYIKGEFTDQYNVTVGVEFTSKTIKIDDKLQVKMQIWDTVPPPIFSPDKKLSAPSCDHSTKASAGSSSPSASTTRRALTIYNSGSKKPEKMHTNRQSSSSSEPNPI